MARGLRNGDGGSHLMTFHPPGGNGSSTWFHNDDWLDFNMRQNGHVTEFTGRYDHTRRDYDRTPVKPVLDGEPIYEDHPVSFKPNELGHSIAADVRRPLYWDLFGGACGHTYGHHSVWQMFDPKRGKPINNPLMPWFEAIDQPGAGQMRHGRALLESRPFLTRIPDDSIIVTDRVATSVPGAGRYRFVATRDTDGTFAMVYAPVGRSFKVRMDAIKGPKIKAWWFNPRDGTATAIGAFATRRASSPPAEGESSTGCSCSTTRRKTTSLLSAMRAVVRRRARRARRLPRQMDECRRPNAPFGLFRRRFLRRPPGKTGSLLNQLIGRLGRARGCLDIERKDDLVSDEIVGLAGVVDIEVVSVDGEIRLEGHLVVRGFDRRRKRDALLHAVKVKVARDRVFVTVDDLGAGHRERGDRVRFDLEKVLVLEVTGESFVVAEGRLHVDLQFRRADQLPIGDLERAGEFFKPAGVASGDLRTGETDFRRFGANDVFLPSDRGTGGRGFRLGRLGFVDLVGRIATTDEQRGNGDNEEEETSRFVS